MKKSNHLRQRVDLNDIPDMQDGEPIPTQRVKGKTKQSEDQTDEKHPKPTAKISGYVAFNYHISPAHSLYGDRRKQEEVFNKIKEECNAAIEDAIAAVMEEYGYPKIEG